MRKRLKASRVSKKLAQAAVCLSLLTGTVSAVLPANVAFAETQPEPDTPLDKQNLKPLSVQSLEALDNGVKLNLGDYQGFIRLFSEDMAKISVVKNGEDEFISPGIAKKDWKTPKFSTKETDKEYILSTSELTVKINKQPFGVKFLDKQGNVINEDAEQGVGYENGKPYAFKKTDATENFYGFGEQSGGLNKRGKSLGMWNTDAYSYNKNTKYLYTSIPFFIGLKDKKAYGIFFDNTFRSYYEMASEKDDYYYFYANGGTLTYYFINGPEIGDVIDRYTELTGKSETPPMWSLGFHQSKWGYTPEELVNVAKTYREKKIPLDTMHFDIDYMDGYRVFTWNDQYKQALKTLKNEGFRAITINDPAVKEDENYSVYQEGTAKDYWAKNPDGTTFFGDVWPGRSAFPNFLKSDVRNWWADNLGTLLNEGVDGIWNDMNEPAVFDGPFHTMPLDVVFEGDNGEKKLHTEYHNLYGHDEAEATYNGFLKHKPNTRPFVLTRDMYAGTQRYAALWTGDNVSNWEHLQMSIPMNANVGLSGVPFVGNDIGGFAKSPGNVPTPELFARWIEVGAFLPFARDHYDNSAKSGLGSGQEPWEFGKEVEDISRKYISMRYELLPYLYNQFKESAENGQPVQQPLVYQFQDDAKTYNIEDQFMFGDSMMLAPVVKEGQTSREVYLPSGETWVDYWTGKKYEGNQSITVKADLGTLPIFVKNNSIIPRQELEQSTDEKKLENLILDTYLNDKASYSFYEDDAETLDYKQGEFNITEFKVEKKGNHIEFQQDKKAQNYASDIKSYTLKLHDAEQPQKVQAAGSKYDQAGSLEQLNGQESGYFFDSAERVLYVKIPANENHSVKIQ
ncbi:glycoside hydrolase family 31 protein [Paenibacillus sp. 7124]|uniref:Glycoside hydrolase family 31 protein n=1 Tax=Paenibacillus apii TaxID=1850370 RepID=A0A6M1PPY3_9BACL|nr:glycoside hydrolase family 31 protein [Paenibacillus apii]NGM84648.1 glycoside hydrolase family 31 protein [Paenibacillus apii]NJJ41265.1 glycoside hydrolase family 31 protein [Paenibacillus apii]